MPGNLRTLRKMKLALPANKAPPPTEAQLGDCTSPRRHGHKLPILVASAQGLCREDVWVDLVECGLAFVCLF